jgi:hypothetical protein
MAKFKVGEKARYVGSPNHSAELAPYRGMECVVVDPLAPRPLECHDLNKPFAPRYGIRFPCGSEAWVREFSLEKLLPKHQPNDLKTAEPQFIHGQFQRWLNPEKEKTLEKSN